MAFGSAHAQERPILLPPVPIANEPSQGSPQSSFSPIEPRPLRVLKLSDLEQIAAGANPTVPAAEALVQQQQGLMQQAALYPNPTVGYVRTDADRQGQTLTNGVFVGQEIVTAGKLRLAVEVGRKEVEHAGWQVEAQRLRVLNDVRIRYFEVLGAKEAIDSAAELALLADEGVTIAKQLIGAGKGTRLDVLQAEMQRSSMSLAVEEARLRYQLAWRQLAHILGHPDMPLMAVEGRIDESIPHVEWEEARHTILANSPLLRGQAVQIQASQAEIQLVRAQAVPNVSVQVVAQRDSIQKYSTVGTFVAIPLPIFNRNQGNILNAQGQLAQQQKELDRLRLAILDQLAVAYRQYMAVRLQAEKMRAEILPRAKENLELSTAAYKQGQFDFHRVLLARQTYFQTKMTYIDAMTELHKSATEIRGMLLTGGLNPTEVGTALQSQAGNTGSRSALLQQSMEQRSSGIRNLPGAIQAGDR